MRSIKYFHFNCCCDTGKIFPVFRNIMLSCESVDLWRCGECGEHGGCRKCGEHREYGEHWECGECGDHGDYRDH